MPKHIHSEQTKSDILNTAKELFLEKGFDSVNIEDIVKALGLTRGAFYHYFKSRDDLIYVVIDQMYLESNPILIAMEQTDLNALEKLKFAMTNSPFPDDEAELLSALSEVLANPVLFKSEVLSQVNTVSPFLEKLIVEGNADGSMSVKNPKQAAQMFGMISLWMNPQIFFVSQQEFQEKLDYAQYLAELLGVPFLDEQVKRILMSRFKKIFE